MQDAIEDKYIEPLVDKHTNLLTNNILRIIKYLLHNYGKVQSEVVSIKKKKLWQCHGNHLSL